MNTVKCNNRHCGKEYNVQFDNCPFCGTANPMPESDRKTLIEERGKSDDVNNVENRQFNGFVTGIIWLSIVVGGIRGTMNCLTYFYISPLVGSLLLGLHIFGIVVLCFILAAKRWAIFAWVGYIVAIVLVNGYYDNDYLPYAFVGALKLVFLFLLLQIKKDGVSAWSIIFSKKKCNNIKNERDNPNVREKLIENANVDIVDSNNSDILEHTDVGADIESSIDKNDIQQTENVSSKNETVQIMEETILSVPEEPSEEVSNSMSAKPQEIEPDKPRVKQNRYLRLIISKWWIYPLIIVAILAIVWLVIWFLHRPSEPELGKYVYVDELSILHVNHNCDKIAAIHGAKPVRMYTLREIKSDKWNQVCSACVSDNTYETILHIIVGNDNTRLLYTTLVEDNYDMPDYEQFLIDIQDTIKQRELHANMGKDGYMLPKFEVFIANLGLVPGQSPLKIGIYEKSHARMLWDELSKKYNVGTFEEYYSKIQEEGRRKKLFDIIKDEYKIDDFERFTRYLLYNEEY